MIEHLSKEVERLERENAILREAINRPIQVLPPAAPSYTETQTLQALQNIQYAVQGMSGSLSMLSANSTPKVTS